MKKNDIENRVARIFFYRKNPETKNLEILFQKRSKFVSGNPGKWDFSAGGHLEIHETPEEAVIRETKEEIGISLDETEIEFIAGLKSLERENSIYYNFLSERTKKEDEFRLDKQEVEEVKWVPFENFEEFFDKNCKNSIKNDEILRMVLRAWLEKKNGNL